MKQTKCLATLAKNNNIMLFAMAEVVFEVLVVREVVPIFEVLDDEHSLVEWIYEI